MRGNKAVIANVRMVTDMVPAPQCYVIANSRKWLDRIVFKNEAVFTHFQTRPNAGLATEIAYQAITFGLGLMKFLGSWRAYMQNKEAAED